MNRLVRQMIPDNLINFYHKLQAIIANIWYGFPAKRLIVIGITGTNGKSTTAQMLSNVLDESGNRNAMVSTIFYKIGKKMWRNNSKMTSLNPFILQKFLRQAVKKKCQFVIIETTSHAIVQSRIWGIDYSTLIFTNITHDHLDYHKTFKNYLEAKLKLFRDNPKARAIINSDDNHSSDFKKVSANQIVTYSLKGKGMVNAKKIKHYNDCSIFTFAWLGNQIEGKINLLGDFNISNALAAFCTALAYNISPKTIVKSLRNIQNIPGRFEYLDFNQNYKIIVDFAHTPDGLQKIFETVRPLVKGRLIHIGGATGERDKTKRPILGAIAAKFADIVIITDEDPGIEKPEDIINQVASGVKRGTITKNSKKLGENFFKIINREKAIKFALSIAEKNDMVLITGKGHEKVMKVGKKLIPYSDQKVIREYFKKEVK